MVSTRQYPDHGGVAVRVIGDGNSVIIITATARLTLDLKHRLNTQRAKTDLQLLRTESREITLVGREAELDRLDAWLATEAEISIRCLTGQAGSGKTRLGIELCERAEKAGWQAGFARHGDLHENLSGWRWGTDTLVVVDYAAASAPALKEWLETLAIHAPGITRLRVLLLERYTETDRGWWNLVFAGRGLTGRGASALLNPPEPVPLEPLRSPAHRRALLVDVMAKAAALAGRSPAPTPPLPGRDPEFDRRFAEDPNTQEPLFLAMAGVVAVTTGAPAALALSRANLANEVAKREERRLEQQAGARGIAQRLLTHLVACVTLQGGCDEAALDALVASETAADGLYTTMPAEQTANGLRDAFPTANGEGAEAIRPDLIGEAFLLHEIGRGGRSAAKQADIVERAYGRAGMAVVRTVLRTVQNFCAGDANHQSLLWLDRLAGPEAGLVQLMAIADALSEQTVGLRERAAPVQDRIAGQLRALAAQRPEAFRPNLAGSLNNRAAMLSELGRPEDALARAEEAVALFRALAAQRPDAFGLDLAMSLNNLANRLSELDRREGALACAEEAVALHRALAAQHPHAFRANLAGSLSNLAAILSELGRREDALVCAEEAVALYCAPAARRPDAFRPDLAMSLNNLAAILSELGRREDALECAAKAVGLYRALAAQRPDAFGPELAGSLNNLANMLSELGRPEDALARAEEAVALYRALAAQHPDVFRSNLAISLNNLANRLSEFGRREDAPACAEEAVGLYRALAAQRPDVFRPDLAMSLSNLAAMLGEVGRREDALVCAEEAVALRRALATQRPDASRPDLAGSLNNLANMLSELGRREDALAYAEEAVALYRALTAQRPNAFQPDLARSLNNLAAMLSEVGRREDALVCAEEAVALRRALAAQRPDAFRPDLAGSLNNLAAMMSELGRREDALVCATEAVALRRALAAQRPDAFRADLAISLAVLANCLDAMNRRVDGMAANAEAIRTITGPFEAMPVVFAGRMASLVRSYLERCEVLGATPDHGLLDPVVGAFARLPAEQEKPS
jgi:tetratricopeptide (TPR) repeat protein